LLGFKEEEEDKEKEKAGSKIQFNKTRWYEQREVSGTVEVGKKKKKRVKEV
jgi:hypothetical protein